MRQSNEPSALAGICNIEERGLRLAHSCWGVSQRHPPARTASRIARVGLVSLHAPELASHVEGIREELRGLGYTDGKTIEIEAHFTNGDSQRVSDIVKSFVERRFDVGVP